MKRCKACRTHNLSTRPIDPVLSNVLHLECLGHALARLGRLATRSLNAVDGVDTAMALAVVDEVEPRDGALVLCTGAGRLGRIGDVVLLEPQLRVWAGGDLVQGEGGDLVLCKEVVAEDALVAHHLQINVEQHLVVDELEGEAGDGADLPLSEGVTVERGADVVEYGWREG